MDTFFIVLGIILLLILFAATFWSNRHEKSRISSLSARPVKSEHDHQPQNDAPPAFVGESQPLPEPETRIVDESHDFASETQERVEGITITIDGETHSAQEQTYAQPQETAQPAEQSTQAETETPELQSTQQAVPQPTMVKIYLLAAQGCVFNGANIAQTLENHGFTFGEYNIFHRHSDNLSTSPVIYSVADMQQPGSFNPAALAEMNTNGLLFFMPLPPLTGSAEVNFKQLLNDVNSIANNMQGYVFDERGKLFDDESRAYYLAMVHQANQ